MFIAGLSGGTGAPHIFRAFRRMFQTFHGHSPAVLMTVYVEDLVKLLKHARKDDVVVFSFDEADRRLKFAIYRTIETIYYHVYPGGNDEEVDRESPPLDEYWKEYRCDHCWEELPPEFAEQFINSNKT